MAVLTNIQRDAVANLTSALVTGARIPQRAIAHEYTEFFAMDYLQLLMKQTAELFRILIDHENSAVVVVACFQQHRLAEPNGDVPDWRDDLSFVSKETDSDNYYESFLNRNRSSLLKRHRVSPLERPWSVVASVLGACSDRGSWCIFGQMDAEIALLGFKRRPDRSFEQELYSGYRIRRLADALNDDRFYGEPGNEISKRQRAVLAANYL